MIVISHRFEGVGRREGVGERGVRNRWDSNELRHQILDFINSQRIVGDPKHESPPEKKKKQYASRYSPGMFDSVGHKIGARWHSSPLVA